MNMVRADVMKHLFIRIKKPNAMLTRCYPMRSEPDSSVEMMIRRVQQLEEERKALRLSYGGLYTHAGTTKSWERYVN